MSRSAFTQNTYLRLQKIYASIRDGMSKVEDYFPAEETDSKPTNSLKPKKEKVDKPVQEAPSIQENSLL